MFNQIDEQWIEIPEQLSEVRKRGHAGIVTFPNGTRSVIQAGGDGTKTAEAFDLETQTWTPIPDIPVPEALYGGASVQYGDTFLIVGGYGSGGLGYTTKIIMYDPRIEDWIIHSQELVVRAKYDTTSFLIPDGFVSCT